MIYNAHILERSLQYAASILDNFLFYHYDKFRLFINFWKRVKSSKY